MAKDTVHSDGIISGISVMRIGHQEIIDLNVQVRETLEHGCRNVSYVDIGIDVLRDIFVGHPHQECRIHHDMHHYQERRPNSGDYSQCYFQPTETLVFQWFLFNILFLVHVF